jgi:hypothetical protein
VSLPIREDSSVEQAGEERHQHPQGKCLDVSTMLEFEVDAKMRPPVRRLLVCRVLGFDVVGDAGLRRL